jgi:hypothetical protein
LECAALSALWYSKASQVLMKSVPQRGSVRLQKYQSGDKAPHSKGCRAPKEIFYSAIIDQKEKSDD